MLFEVRAVITLGSGGWVCNWKGAWGTCNILFLDLDSSYMDIFVKIHQAIPYDMHCSVCILYFKFKT